MGVWPQNLIDELATYIGDPATPVTRQFRLARLMHIWRAIDAVLAATQEIKFAASEGRSRTAI